MLIFEIEGKPIPQPRARHFSIRNRSFAYNPKKKQMEIMKMLLLNEKRKIINDERLIELAQIESGCEIFVEMTFYMEIPKSLNHKSRMVIFGDGDEPHNKKPDLDNLIKWVLDCGNKILWKDDSSVVKIMAKKVWSDRPRTKILFGRYKNTLG